MLTKTESRGITPELLQWQKDYKMQAEQKLTEYKDYVADTDYYLINDPIIQKTADDIRSRSASSEEAVDRTLEWVFDNVQYQFNEPDSACFEGTAPDIITKGIGQCDTQSIVVISLLRNMGVAARSAGGCVVPKPCGLQAFITPTIPTLENPVQQLPLSATAKSFSRGVDIQSRQGGLHAWAMYWDSSKGWVQMEPTQGTLANLDCFNYHIELIPTDEQKKLLCISENYDYAKACQRNDLITMNQEGLGLAQVVS